ncbi:MAG: hypothetical protein A2157_13290 [Deltaproteobacteria bacterium RBG_16_47_11]|nr:MAG: hypothetical protein A2157_13290 [Deltaproteobacteria bacterium RBG_16_47_11]
MRNRAFLLAVILFSWVALAHSDGQKLDSGPGAGRVFLYSAKKLGVPILKASLYIENGSSAQGKSLYQIRAEVFSVNLGFLFRMNNRFISTVDAETCTPIRYIKEIDQDGLFKEKKNYLQTVTFDSHHQIVIVEKTGEKEKQEVPVPPETFDPLSMFARYYLKESLLPHQDIRMSIYDGVKLREMVFQPKQERVKSKIYGEVEAVCLKSTTSFASFEDKEGIIRIWYTSDAKKIPIVMELDLPVGSIRFELNEIKEDGQQGNMREQGIRPRNH